MTDFIPSHRLFTGRKAALIIVAFFGVIIAVNGLMLTLAVSSFGGLVVGNSYVASQNFNADIAAARAQPIRGWTLDLRTDAQTVSLVVRDADGSVLRNLDIVLTLARPTHERDTVTVPMREDLPGRYQGAVVLAPGRWIATVATADGQTRSLSLDHGSPDS